MIGALPYELLADDHFMRANGWTKTIYRLWHTQSGIIGA